MIKIVLIVFTLTSYVFADETLFAPTPIDVINQALKLAKIKQNDVLIDLGCGDGRVPIVASALYNIHSYGIDIDKSCIILSKKNIQLNNLTALVDVTEGNALNIDFENNCTVVFIYLMPDLSSQLIPQLLKLPRGSRIIAHDKTIPGLSVNQGVKVWSKEDNRYHTIYIWELK